MNVKFFVNDHILIWNLLFQASISEQIYNLKQKLWANFKSEYNNTYRDKSLILSDPKNFIPNDDTIYNIMTETREYEKLKRSTEKYRMELMKLWDSNKRLITAFVKTIIKKDLRHYRIYVVNEDLDVIDTDFHNTDTATIIVGKKIDKKEPMRIILDIVMAIIKEEIKFSSDRQDLGEAIVELAVLNELATMLTKKSCYISGQPSLESTKRCLYPYWLMYLAVPKGEFQTYMARDKIDFDANNLAYEKELKKMNLDEFIDFCHRNRRYMIRKEKIELEVI